MTWITPQWAMQPQQGWQCPVCKKVNAPFMPQCTCDGNIKTTLTTTTDKTEDKGGNDE